MVTRYFAMCEKQAELLTKLNTSDPVHKVIIEEVAILRSRSFHNAISESNFHHGVVLSGLSAAVVAFVYSQHLQVYLCIICGGSRTNNSRSHQKNMYSNLVRLL
jgi:hypothetical protein